MEYFMIFVVPTLLMFGIMWILLIRPQQKKQQSHQAMVAQVKKGDHIETIGGISGVISVVKTETVFLKTASSEIEINKLAIATVKVKEEVENKAAVKQEA